MAIFFMEINTLSQGDAEYYLGQLVLRATASCRMTRLLLSNEYIQNNKIRRYAR